MFNGDRTTKVLLTCIALFLGILVCKSLFQSTPRAQAQTTTAQTTANTVQNYDATTRNTQNAIIGYRTVLLSSLSISSKDKLRGIMVMDSAQSFLVQYDNRIEVYRVDGVMLGNTGITTDDTQQ